MSLPRCNGLETIARSSPLQKLMVKFEVSGDEWLTRTFLEGLTDVEPTESSTELPSQDRVIQHPVETREIEGDAAARGEHGKHADHDGCFESVLPWDSACTAVPD